MRTVADVPNLLPHDGEARLVGAWLGRGDADALFDRLTEELDWAQEAARFFAREVPLPRLTAWYGEVAYRYSGVVHPPGPWPAALVEVRDRLRELGPVNTVLANLYRSGADSMGWHSDDEAELGPEPTIFSLSLGATRRFSLRHRESGERIDVDLTPGSLLVMAGACQHAWRHALPRTSRPVGARINLTFRWTGARPDPSRRTK